MKDSKQDRENWYSSLSNVPSHTYKGKQKVTRPYRGMTSSKINKQHYCASLLHITPEGKQTLQKYKSMVLLMDFTGRPFTVALYSDKLPMKYYTKQWKYCTKQWLKKKKEKAGASKCSKPQLLRTINFIFRTALPLCFWPLQMHYYTTVAYVIHCNSTWLFKKSNLFLHIFQHYQVLCQSY